MSVAIERWQEARVLGLQEKGKERLWIPGGGSRRTAPPPMVLPAPPRSESQVAPPSGVSAGTSDHRAGCWAPRRGSGCDCLAVSRKVIPGPLIRYLVSLSAWGRKLIGEETHSEGVRQPRGWLDVRCTRLEKRNVCADRNASPSESYQNQFFKKSKEKSAETPEMWMLNRE